MYSLLAQCEAALVTSGTATLETALMGVPQVVCYKMNNISYQIGKRLVKLDYISLVNLILDKPCITELIQDEFNVTRLKKELQQLLSDKETEQRIKNHYNLLNSILGNSKPSEEVAQQIYSAKKN